MTGLSQLLFGKDSQPPQQAQERVTRDTAVASTIPTELFYCMNLLCFSKQLLKFVRLIPNSSPPRRREAIVVSLYPPGSAMSLLIRQNEDSRSAASAPTCYVELMELVIR